MPPKSPVIIPKGVVIRGPLKPGFETVLNNPALEFLANLHRHFEERRQGVLRFREKRQDDLDAGIMPNFLEHTKEIRDGHWKAAYIPHDLLDRRVEITGPVDRKMVINALNSGAKVFMADFEDSSSPTWQNMIEGQINLKEAVRKTISFKNEQGKEYKLRPAKELATLMVRPRGWHLDEEHLTIDGQVMSASLFDFGLYFIHNAHQLMKQASAPYFYLPKMESHIEARLWNDVFVYAQHYIGIPRGTIRATVLLETILAAFEMNEILFELREHSAGMNCGRWDYIFSAIKKFKAHKQCVFPDRAEVTMTVPFMHAYVELVIQTCHKRGVHAIGGMAAQIPVKGNPELNKAALEKVHADKLREVKAGHDGTWVAHPDLINIAMKVFDEFMPNPHQIHVLREDVKPNAQALLPVNVKGSITEAGLRGNINVGLQYVESWLRGVGCVPIHNLMEDAATAEICRSQIWQWIRHGAKMKTQQGEKTINKELVRQLLSEEVAKIKQSVGDQKFKTHKWVQAVQLYERMMLSDHLADFLTTEAYPQIRTFSTPLSRL